MKQCPAHGFSQSCKTPLPCAWKGHSERLQQCQSREHPWQRMTLAGAAAALRTLPWVCQALKPQTSLERSCCRAGSWVKGCSYCSTRTGAETEDSFLWLFLKCQSCVQISHSPIERRHNLWHSKGEVSAACKVLWGHTVEAPKPPCAGGACAVPAKPPVLALRVTGLLSPCRFGCAPGRPCWETSAVGGIPAPTASFSTSQWPCCPYWPSEGCGKEGAEDTCYSPNLPPFTLTAILISTVSTLWVGKWPQHRRNAVSRIHRTSSCSERCNLQILYTWTRLCSPIPAVPAEVQRCVATVPAVPCIFCSRGCNSIMSLAATQHCQVLQVSFIKEIPRNFCRSCPELSHSPPPTDPFSSEVC